jgi:hypothetical protein
MWNGPLAYGNSVVTKSLRDAMGEGDFSLDFKAIPEGKRQ